MIELLLFVLGLIVGGVFCALVSLPFIIFGVRSAKRTPEKAGLRALPWSLGAGCLSGFVLGATGFFWGAGVGDESAGAIAVMLFGIGSVAGFVLGGGVTFTIIMTRAKK